MLARLRINGRMVHVILTIYMPGKNILLSSARTGTVKVCFLARLSAPLLIHGLSHSVTEPLRSTVDATFNAQRSTLRQAAFISRSNKSLRIVRVNTFIILDINGNQLRRFLRSLNNFLATRDRRIRHFTRLLPTSLINSRTNFLNKSADTQRLDNCFRLPCPLALNFLIHDVPTMNTNDNRLTRFITSRILISRGQCILATIIRNSNRAGRVQRGRQAAQPNLSQLTIILFRHSFSLLRRIGVSGQAFFR